MPFAFAESMNRVLVSVIQKCDSSTSLESINTTNWFLHLDLMVSYCCCMVSVSCLILVARASRSCVTRCNSMASSWYVNLVHKEQIFNIELLHHNSWRSFHVHGVPQTWDVVAERIRAPNTSSGVYVQQSAGSSPCHDTCVGEQDT